MLLETAQAERWLQVESSVLSLELAVHGIWFATQVCCSVSVSCVLRWLGCQLDGRAAQAPPQLTTITGQHVVAAVYHNGTLQLIGTETGTYMDAPEPFAAGLSLEAASVSLGRCEMEELAEGFATPSCAQPVYVCHEQDLPSVEGPGTGGSLFASGISRQEAQAGCDANPECNAFAWNRVDGSTYLKQYLPAGAAWPTGDNNYDYCYKRSGGNSRCVHCS